MHHDLADAATSLVNAIVAGSATEPFGDVMRRYAPVAVVMNDFYGSLHEGRLTTTYPAAAIPTALQRADLLA